MARIDGFDELSRKLDELADYFGAETKGRISGAGRAGGRFISPDGYRVKQRIGQGVADAMENGVVPDAKARASRHVTGEAVESIQYEQVSWNEHRFGATHDLVKYHEYGTSTRAEDKARATINAPGGDGYVIPLDGYDSLPFGPDAVSMMDELNFQFVVHPGVRGKHFMRDALDGNTWLIEEKVAEELDDVEIDI